MQLAACLIAAAVILKGKSGTQVANILNFNVGPEVELTLPPVFFSRLRLLFGSNKFVKEQVRGFFKMDHQCRQSCARK
jgi:hypothetical protein